MYKDIICGIYCIENIVNNKKYIGQSVNIKHRWNTHKRSLRNNCRDNSYLQYSWNKYGEENFKFKVLEYCEKGELDYFERYYIDLFNSCNPQFGYNLKSGGQDSGVVDSDYVKNKISESVKQSYNDELRELKRQLALKQWSNPSIKEKIIGKNNGMFGKHHTDDAKEKMSKARLGVESSRKNHQPVICIELNKEYSCASDAEKETGIQSGTILAVCRGKRKSCGGYHWKFKSEK